MDVAVAGPARSVSRAYDRLALRPAWVVCASLIVLSGLSNAAGFTPGPIVRYGPLALSLVLLGLPHGAVDHLVPARLADTSLAVSLSLVGLCYLLLGGLYAVLWLLAPVPAALLFVALTWFHWGQGEIHALIAFVGTDHLRSRALRSATLVTRGGIPMLLPLLAFPERYRAVVDAWVGLFGAELATGWLFAVDTRLLLGGGFLAITLLTLNAGYRAAGAAHGWRVDAVETALLWAFFLTVPPLIAVGVYFCLLHSLRHVLRLSGINDPPTSSRTLFTSFARDAAPLTAVSIVLLAGFGILVPATPTTLPGIVALYLVFVAVVTLPHVVVVSWMDHREGVWHG
ncbi:MAG: Brp/Blh family beta-carotene 15,15'-dioxygenase [Halobacteriales archaeon]